MNNRCMGFSASSYHGPGACRKICLIPQLLGEALQCGGVTSHSDKRMTCVHIGQGKTRV